MIKQSKDSDILAVPLRAPNSINMQFHMFPPELLHVVAYGGWLVPHDVLNLACASEALMEKLVGDEYGKDWLRALSGLKKCVENDCTRAVRFALQTEDPSVDDNWPIRHAAEYGQTKTVQVLLADPRVDPSAQGNDAIFIAASLGRLDVVRLLLADPRVDPSTDDNDAFCMAAEYGQTETVQVLLADPRVDPSAQGNYAIRWASVYGHTETVQVLLADPRVDPSEQRECAILT